MTMNLSDVLFDNVLRRSAAWSYSGAVTAGFEPQNAWDWRDFSIFKPAAGTTSLSHLLYGGTQYDTIVVWCTFVGTATCSSIAVQDQYGNTLASLTPTPASPLVTVRFAMQTVSGGGNVTFVPIGVSHGTGYFGIRQMTIGPRLTFPIGQWNDVNPLTLNQGQVMENVISMNGSIIARNVRRVEKKTSIELTHLTPTWIRTYWEQLSLHATRYAFWYWWNPTTYPNDTAMCAAEEIVAPTNMMPPPFMKVSMPVRALT